MMSLQKEMISNQIKLEEQTVCILKKITMRIDEWNLHSFSKKKKKKKKRKV